MNKLQIMIYWDWMCTYYLRQFDILHKFWKITFWGKISYRDFVFAYFALYLLILSVRVEKRLIVSNEFDEFRQFIDQVAFPFVISIT